MTVRAVSFDVTGTLLGLSRLGAVYSEVLARHGIDVEPATVARAAGDLWQELSFTVRLGEDRFTRDPEGARGFWRQLLEATCRRLELPAPTPFAAAELYERFAQADAWELYSDVRPALVELRRSGLRLAVVSNFDERLPRLLEAVALTPLLETVVHSSEIGVEKPHPAIFEALIERLGLSPEEVLHVGDSQREDVEGARAVGLHALHLDRGGKSGDLSTLLDLPERLPSLARQR